MPFEEFMKTRPVKDKPIISISKQGIIGLNQACYNKYLKQYSYVILLFDKDSNKIGIKPTNEDKINSYKIRVTRNGSLAQISATAFLKYFNILYEKTRIYTCMWNDEEKLLEVKL